MFVLVNRQWSGYHNETDKGIIHHKVFLTKESLLRYYRFYENDLPEHLEIAEVELAPILPD